jgi:hypothetical protein
VVRDFGREFREGTVDFEVLISAASGGMAPGSGTRATGFEKLKEGLGTGSDKCGRGKRARASTNE